MVQLWGGQIVGLLLLLLDLEDVLTAGVGLREGRARVVLGCEGHLDDGRRDVARVRCGGINSCCCVWAREVRRVELVCA